MAANTAATRDDAWVVFAILAHVSAATIECCIRSATWQTLLDTEAPAAADDPADPGAAVAAASTAKYPRRIISQPPARVGRQARVEPVDGSAMILAVPSHTRRHRLRLLLHGVLARHERPAGAVLSRGQAELAFSDLGFDPASQPWLAQRRVTATAPCPNLGVQAGGHGPALRPFLQRHSQGYEGPCPN